jgi:glucose/arabinose dehydrogenase
MKHPMKASILRVGCTATLALRAVLLCALSACDGDRVRGAATSAVAGAADPAASRPAAPPRKPTGLRFETVLQRLPNLPPIPVQLVPHPDGGSFFILGRNGELCRYDRPLEAFPVTGEALPPSAAKFPGRISRVQVDGSFASGDLGTLALALDPDFTTNAHFYVWYADKPGKNVVLDRFTWGPVAADVAKSRVKVIGFSRRDPPAPYHMGGVLKFLPDKTLIVMSGDAERPELAQNRLDLNGKLLRIRPRYGAEGGYDVPADNPHLGDAEWRPEIVCSGLRAPFRGFLRRGKELWFGDVGAVFEEVNVWRGGTVDYGWGHGPVTDGINAPEGTEKPHVVWSQTKDFAFEDPDYDGDARLSAGFGVIYEDVVADRYAGFLAGKALFFDIMRGWVRAAEIGADGRLGEHRHVGHRSYISDMIVGRDGYIYGVTWDAPVSVFRLRLSHEIKPAPKSARVAPSEVAAPRRDGAK